MPTDVHALRLEFPRETSSSISETALRFSLISHNLWMIFFGGTGLSFAFTMFNFMKLWDKNNECYNNFLLLLYSLAKTVLRMPMKCCSDSNSSLSNSNKTRDDINKHEEWATHTDSAFELILLQWQQWDGKDVFFLEMGGLQVLLSLLLIYGWRDEVHIVEDGVGWKWGGQMGVAAIKMWAVSGKQQRL